MIPLAAVYVIAAVVSVMLALWLARLARLSGYSGRTEKKVKAEELFDDDASKMDDSLKKAITAEMKEVVSSKEQAREISKKLANMFDQELAKKTTFITNKFETVIQGKAESEEVAWKKYKKVLVDKKRTEAVIHSIAEGLVVVDDKGKVIMMNPAAEKLLGTSKKNKIGKEVTENLSDEHLISLSKDGPDQDKKEIEVVSGQADTKKVLRASSAVIEDGNGQTVGMVSVLSDITKQKELDRMKSMFVASVTHELRTPLLAIGKSIALMLTKTTGELTEAQEHFLAIADRNLKRLSTLINSLLDLSKLEAGKMEIKPEPSSIDKVIKESVDGLDVWAQSKHIRINRNIQDDLPNINIDADRITQVLINLLGNSIKFTPQQGNITVEAAMQGDNMAVEISIKDSGAGIAKEDLPKIFSKFYQSSERITSDINGTGIGLSIAKEIVSLHGGKIWVESEKGQGARFVFTLPLEK